MKMPDFGVQRPAGSEAWGSGIVFLLHQKAYIADLVNFAGSSTSATIADADDDAHSQGAPPALQGWF